MRGHQKDSLSLDPQGLASRQQPGHPPHPCGPHRFSSGTEFAGHTTSCLFTETPFFGPFSCATHTSRRSEAVAHAKRTTMLSVKHTTNPTCGISSHTKPKERPHLS